MTLPLTLFGSFARPRPRVAGCAVVRPTLEAIYEEHFEYVWRTLLRLGVYPDAAPDAAQNVFLVVHRRLASYDPARPVRPWLFGIARNVAREHRRRVASRRETTESEPVALDPRSVSGPAEHLAAAQIVHRALAELDETRRAVFVLHALDEVPMKEVAEALEMPLNTAYSHFRRGREEFRTAATRWGAVS